MRRLRVLQHRILIISRFIYKGVIEINIIKFYVYYIYFLVKLGRFLDFKSSLLCSIFYNQIVDKIPSKYFEFREMISFYGC
jgi:hypothetical protein